MAIPSGNDHLCLSSSFSIRKILDWGGINKLKSRRFFSKMLKEVDYCNNFLKRRAFKFLVKGVIPAQTEKSYLNCIVIHVFFLSETTL